MSALKTITAKTFRTRSGEHLKQIQYGWTGKLGVALLLSNYGRSIDRSSLSLVRHVIDRTTFMKAKRKVKMII